MLTFFSSFIPRTTTTTTTTVRLLAILPRKQPPVHHRNTFHSSTYRTKQKFHMPFSVTLSKKDKVNKKAESVTLLPETNHFKLKPFADNIMTRRDVLKTARAVEKMQAKTEDEQAREVHETMRKKIVSGKAELSYREIQQLCSLNNLGAKGTKAVLTQRLLAFFERVSPERVAAMSHWELLNVRGYLEPDKNEEYQEEKRKDEARRREEKDITRREWFEKETQRMRRNLRFTADLEA